MAEKVLYLVTGPRRSGVSTLITQLQKEHSNSVHIVDKQDIYRHWDKDVIFLESHEPYVEDGPNATFPWRDGHLGGPHTMTPNRRLIQIDVTQLLPHL